MSGSDFFNRWNVPALLIFHIVSASVNKSYFGAKNISLNVKCCFILSLNSSCQVFQFQGKKIVYLKKKGKKDITIPSGHPYQNSCMENIELISLLKV